MVSKLKQTCVQPQRYTAATNLVADIEYVKKDRVKVTGQNTHIRTFKNKKLLASERIVKFDSRGIGTGTSPELKISLNCVRGVMRLGSQAASWRHIPAMQSYQFLMHYIMHCRPWNTLDSLTELFWLCRRPR